MTLSVVATPIGNLEDVTLRALRTLREADLVLAEDTRRTRTLLERHGIRARPRSLHAHNEAARIREVLAALAAGSRVALVSDAGTPLVSDPGERLVAAALAAGFAVEPVPGPSAVLAALTASGLPAVPFAFLGFLPRRKSERAARLAAWRDRPETLVLFESPRRAAATLAELARALGDRPACLARELTKLHEEVRRGSLADLAREIQGELRGEVTIVVGGAARDAVRTALRTSAADPAGAAPDLDGEIRRLLAAGEGSRAIARELAARRGLSRREVYARTLALRGRP
ncbi:MAG TPA: 16S rRNA (cytidine(1402)-2'-O)-methyltransferase [Myxococcota bacterium]|nr:16S rRNA (cytidine(1402)-2'-O)-methyltransferase [Myxococcota bacterium]